PPGGDQAVGLRRARRVIRMAVIVAEDLEAGLAALPLDLQQVLRRDRVADAGTLRLAVHGPYHALDAPLAASQQHAADLEGITLPPVLLDVQQQWPGDFHRWGPCRER